jgi:zinc protease
MRYSRSVASGFANEHLHKEQQPMSESIRRFSAAGCGLLVLVTISTPLSKTWSEEPVTTPRLTVETYTLENGLKVALSHDPAAPRTTVSVAYHVGSKNERPGLTGFAHFFEHMMFRGTKNVPNFDEPLQEAGGSPNAFTSEDVTIYFETIPNHYLQRALYMEAERMGFLSSALDQEKFDTEREVVKNERRQVMENVPYGLADETLSYHLFPQGHPYSWSVIGSMNDLNNASLDDLRQFFLEFYHPANATLTLVGGFDPTEARAWIETFFGPLAKGPALAPLAVPPTRPVSQRVVQKDSVQFPRVYWAWPTVPESDPDAPALDLLGSILSDGDASRLMQALVIQAQSAVDVSASSNTNEVGGQFEISATAAPNHTVAELEQQIQAEMARIQAEGPTADELSRVLSKHRTSLLAGLASPMQRNLVIALGLTQFQDPHHYQTMFTRYAEVTPADIQRVAKQYLPETKVVLVVEPVGEGEEESVAVQGGPLPATTPAVKLEPREAATGPDWTVMPAATARKPFVAPAYSKHKLSNGLEVWISPWNTLPLVATRLLVATGSTHDDAAHAGLAQLTATLWDQGTQTLTSTQLAEALDALGTSLDIGSNVDTTELSFSVESQALPKTLELVGQMIAEPRFDESDFQREQQLQLSELASGPDSTSWIADRVFPTLLFSEQHPWGSPAPGYVSTVKGLTREQVQQFYRDHFAPQDSVLIVVGNVDPEKLLRLLETTLGGWKASAAAPTASAPAKTAATQPIYFVDKPGAVQSVITVGRTWRERLDTTYFATRVGNRILGGDFLSRINQNLRERNGFTYGARSGFEYHRNFSEWTVQTSVRAEVTGAALREILHELQGVAGDRALTESEVLIARDAEGNTFPEAFETPGRIASALAQMAIFQLPDDYFAKFVEQMDQTTPDQVTQAMAPLVARDQNLILVVGNRQVVESKLTEAGFTQIILLDTDGRPVKTAAATEDGKKKATAAEGNKKKKPAAVEGSKKKPAAVEGSKKKAAK